MRKLKFRVWDKDLCKYLEGCEISGLMADFDAEGEGREVIIKQICPARYRFEQYTGLKDKNGKEIYEGDIVEVLGKYSDVYQTYSGEWVLSHFCKDDDPISSLIWHCDKKQIEVIGNIHENPELLGGEK